MERLYCAVPGHNRVKRDQSVPGQRCASSTSTGQSLCWDVGSTLHIAKRGLEVQCSMLLRLILLFVFTVSECRRTGSSLNTSGTNHSLPRFRELLSDRFHCSFTSWDTGQRSDLMCFLCPRSYLMEKCLAPGVRSCNVICC